MYGWRARIGLLVAHPNSVIEPEFNRLAPEGVAVYASRVRLGELTRDGFLEMRSSVEGAARELSELSLDAVAFACTAGTFVGGAEYDDELVSSVAKIVGCPVVSASGSVIGGLRAVDAKRLSVVTPYKAEVNVALEGYLKSEGFSVEKLLYEDVSGRSPIPPYTNRPIGHPGFQQPELWYRLAQAAMTPDTDCMFLSAAGIRALEIAQSLEDCLGVPVVTSVQALLWATLRSAGVGTKIPGYGRLLTLPKSDRLKLKEG